MLRWASPAPRASTRARDPTLLGIVGRVAQQWVAPASLGAPPPPSRRALPSPTTPPATQRAANARSWRATAARRAGGTTAAPTARTRYRYAPRTRTRAWRCATRRSAARGPPPSTTARPGGLHLRVQGRLHQQPPLRYRWGLAAHRPGLCGRVPGRRERLPNLRGRERAAWSERQRHNTAGILGHVQRARVQWPRRVHDKRGALHVRVHRRLFRAAMQRVVHRKRAACICANSNLL